MCYANSVMSLFVTLWTVATRILCPESLWAKKAHWSGLPFSSSRISQQRSNLSLESLPGRDSSPLEPPGIPMYLTQQSPLYVHNLFFSAYKLGKIFLNTIFAEGTAGPFWTLLFHFMFFRCYHLTSGRV